MKLSEQNGLSPTTLRGYRGLVGLYLVPAIGGCAVGDLTAKQNWTPSTVRCPKWASQPLTSVKPTPS